MLRIFIATIIVLFSAAEAEAFTAHKAIYDFRMISAEQGAGITGIDGQMYYEQDDACDAWTSDHRFSVRYHYPERRPVGNTNHYVSWEAKDGKRFHFNSSRQEDGLETEQLRGAVDRRADGSARAEYVRPENLSHELPSGYLLPMQHTEDIIRRARAGEKVFSGVLFDGTDAEGPVEVNVVVGKKISRDEVLSTVKRGGKLDETLLSPDAWRIRMAFFLLSKPEEMLPAYEMDIILHDNGVVSHSVVDYRSFKVEQKLQAIEKLPARKCG